MPTTETPAAGYDTTASAQVLNRRILIVHTTGFANFGPNPIGPSAGALLRQACLTQTNNLPCVFINLFLFPDYTPNNSITVFRARNYLQWRPVFQMPPDVFPDDVGIATGDANAVGGVGGWLPFTSPMILPVAAPISFRCSCAGVEQISIEVRVPADGVPAPDQGVDRIAFSISASS